MWRRAPGSDRCCQSATVRCSIPVSNHTKVWRRGASWRTRRIYASTCGPSAPYENIVVSKLKASNNGVVIWRWRRGSANGQRSWPDHVKWKSFHRCIYCVRTAKAERQASSSKVPSSSGAMASATVRGRFPERLIHVDIIWAMEWFMCSVSSAKEHQSSGATTARLLQYLRTCVSIHGAAVRSARTYSSPAIPWKKIFRRSSGGMVSIGIIGNLSWFSASKWLFFNINAKNAWARAGHTVMNILRARYYIIAACGSRSNRRGVPEKPSINMEEFNQQNTCRQVCPASESAAF